MSYKLVGMVCVVTLGDSQAPGLSFFFQLGVGIVIRIPGRTHLTPVAGVVLAQVLAVGAEHELQFVQIGRYGAHAH